MRLSYLPVAMMLLVAAIAPVAAAQALTDPNPAVPEWVESTIVIAQPDLTTLEITASIVIRQYVVEGTSYDTADEIGNAYQQLVQADEFARQNGQTSTRAENFVRDIENTATRTLRETLERNFPNAQVTVEDAFLDRSTLSAPRGDPFSPGVSLSIDAAVVRPLSDLGLDGYSLDAVDAVFDAGATISSDLTLTASPGHSVLYVLTPPSRPSGLAFESAAPADIATIDGNALVVSVDNAAGSDTRSAVATFAMVDPVAREAAPDAEDISASIEISLGALTRGMTSLPIEAALTSEIRALDVAERFADSLPANVQLAYLSADALRALHESGALSSQDIEDANEQLRSSLAADFQSIMPDVTVTGGLVEDDLHMAPSSPFSTEPPVRFEAVAKGGYAMPEGSENADLALRIGAIITFDISLPAQKSSDTSVTINAPGGAIFSNASAGTLASDGKSVGIEIPADPDEGVQEVTLSIRDPAARTYTAEDAKSGASFGAVLDLQDIDIAIGKAINGDMGALVGEVTVTAKMGVFEIPAEFKGALPENLDLAFLTADAVRLLAERGVITPQQVADLEKAFQENVTKNLRDALQVPIEVEGGLAAGTMDAAGITTPSGDKPITLEAKASFRKPLSGGAAPPATAATTLYSMPQSFKLPSVQGLATTYKVILPPGIAVSDLKVDRGTSETGSENGRDYFVVTPDSGKEAQATMNVGVTPSFVVAKFWPVLLLAVLVIFLLVGGPIALVVLRRRKKKAQE